MAEPFIVDPFTVDPFTVDPAIFACAGVSCIPVSETTTAAAEPIFLAAAISNPSACSRRGLPDDLVRAFLTSFFIRVGEHFKCRLGPAGQWRSKCLAYPEVKRRCSYS